MGTFSKYYREPRSPNSHDLELIELATHLARVAIERDRAEEALRRSEGFLADGQRISHTGTWGWNIATGKVVWSDEHFRIFGFDPEKTEPSFKLFLETVHPEDRLFIERGLDEAVREKSGFDMEFRIALADGSIKNVQGVGRPVLTQSGDIDNYIATTVDITARKRAEHELRRKEAYLSEAQKVSLTGSFGWKYCSGELIGSDETFRILGYDRATKPALDLVMKRVHPDDVARVQH